MKKNFWLLVIFIFSLFSSLHAQTWDLEKDQEINAILTSDAFSNTLVSYRFDNKEYPIRFIHNPKKEILWGSYLTSPSSLALMVITDVPIPLARHLEDLVLEVLGSYDNCYFALQYETPKIGWNLIWPVYIAEKIEDPINDEYLLKTFNSTNFVNQVIYYHLNGQYYQVRLLHNPEGKKFSANKKFRLKAAKPLETFSYSWNKTYAIALDKKAPRELINYLSAKLKHLSYWDWYFNFDLDNGTYVTYTEHGYNERTTYDLDTCFNFMESFGQDNVVN